MEYVFFNASDESHLTPEAESHVPTTNSSAALDGGYEHNVAVAAENGSSLFAPSSFGSRRREKKDRIILSIQPRDCITGFAKIPVQGAAACSFGLDGSRGEYAIDVGQGKTARERLRPVMAVPAEKKLMVNLQYKSEYARLPSPCVLYILVQTRLYCFVQGHHAVSAFSVVGLDASYFLHLSLSCDFFSPVSTFVRLVGRLLHPIGH